MNWEKYYLDLAEQVATGSKDPSTKIGAIIVRPDNTPVSFGYNDFPRGVKNLPERWNNREEKLKFIVHAETNAILNSREPLKGCTIYMRWAPCHECAKNIVQSGISCVVIKETNLSRWNESFEIAQKILSEGGVERRVVSVSETDNALISDSNGIDRGR